ncbi:hypothetical protein MtrunA17_Chr6g0484311 [Medicago truncatula]|uniref:VQ motif protein n=2 Tax=Medicago truncatula TaxID=3880 RepID=G7KN20_MEDTR|nr:VQ motif protein [Medicago truncatula]RHN52789.1 hypothetical protein MtrunA17_Chr6g0484311 [Medicago truncatula]
MSPSQFHPKKEIISTTTKSNTNVNGLLPPHLKINKDSHFIKKSSPSPPSSSSSSSSSTSSAMMNTMVASNKPPQQHRSPVIIYTHSPRVIHTQPKDFMALVQKLTGLSRSEEDDGSKNGKNASSSQYQTPKKEPVSCNYGMLIGDKENDRKNVVLLRNEDNDTSSSVITDENNYGNNVGENQVNSCFIPSDTLMLEPPLNPYMTNFLASSSAEFMCSSQPLLNYSDSFFSHNMRTLGGMKEFGDY